MVSVFFARSPAVAGTSLVVATLFPLAGSKIGVAVCSLRVTSGVRSGSGGDFNLPQNLTSTDLHWRSAMASTPDCRIASVSRPAPTGYSVLPLLSDAPGSLAAERQPMLDPTRSHRPVTGMYPVIHEPWTTQRAVEELALIPKHRVFIRRPIQERRARPPRDGLSWRVPARGPEGCPDAR